MAYSLGFAHGRITLTYNGGPAAAQLRADLLRVIAVARAAHEGVQRFGRQVDRMSDGLTSAAKFAGKAALGITGITHAVVFAAAAAQTLAPIFAAAFAALPGLIVAGVVTLGVFKLATKGVGDALKAAGEDSKTFEKAIAGLSPQAQKFAVAWRDAGKSLSPIQKAMQDAFFSETGPRIDNIATAAGALKTEAGGVAEGFNDVFRRVLEFAASGTAINTVRSILNGVRLVLINVANGVQPLLTGFFNLARQAGVFGGAVGGALATAMTTFGNFLNNVDLSAVFDRAMEVLRPLGTLLADIGSIISSVFSGLAVEGGSSLGVLGEMVGKLAEFLRTAEGQEGLKAIGEAFVAISGATGEVFLTLLKELTPVIVALAPGIAQLAQAVADVLVPALQIAGPILTSVAGFISRNMDVIAPLIIGIYGLAAAMRIYSAVTAAATAIQAAYNSALLASALAWVRTTAATIAGAAATAYARVVTLAGAAATWIASAATAVWGVITLIATSPITLIIIAIIALIAVIVLIATKTTWFQDAWAWAWGGIKAAAMAVWNWLSGTLWPGIVGVWNSIYAFIAERVRATVAVFQAIWGAILAVIGFFAKLREQAIAKLNELLSFVKSLPGMIGSALGNLGNLLYDKGKELVNGFINGIKNMFGAVKQTAENLVGMVTDFLPGSPAKKGPLSGKGWTPFRGKSLVDGLMSGMESQLADLERLASQVAVAAVPVMPTLVGGAGLLPSTIPGVQPLPAPSERAGVTFNQTVNALPGMSAQQVAQYSHRRLVLGLRTGASILVTEPDPEAAGA